MKDDFLAVILGSDWNVYGVASSLHQAYGMKSVALCMRRQMYTDNLDFLDVYAFDDFDNHDVFVKVLIDFAEKNKDKEKKLLLISCSDYYTSLIIESRDEIKDYYIFNYIDKKLHDNLENKIDFYNICEEYGLSYPNTYIVSRDSYRNINLPFDFPVICKPNDSYKWVKVDFEGYKKAFKINNMEELVHILDLAYLNGYDDYMIIQDFIPGGADSMFVVNAYVSKEGKVLMTHGAQTALEEVLPNDIGNYSALISGDFPDLTSSVKEFLEKIDYRGYANFDFKYDKRSGDYKVFEINLRQGRSSMYMTYAGNNFITYLVDDLIYDKDIDYYNHTDEHLWYITAKSVLKKYSPSSLKGNINRLLKEGKSNFALDYYSNKNIKRFLLSLRRKISTIRYYRIYAR